MKKPKKKEVTNNINLFKPDVKSSRVTIDSRVCNPTKFNEFFELVDNDIKSYKNTVSQYCYDNLLPLILDYNTFVKDYKLLNSSQLNSWETQTIFHEISGHYSETSTRYLDKATFISSNHTLSEVAKLIYKQSNLICTYKDIKDSNKNTYKLDFNINDKLIQLNNYLTQYKSYLVNVNNILIQLNLIKEKNLTEEQVKQLDFNNKEKIKLERLIKSYNKLIVDYSEIKILSINKTIIYNRLIQLIIDKKVRLISKVNLGIYKTGTHARSLNNSQMSIVKDNSNNKFQYFIKVRKLSTLTSREPKLSKELNKEYQLKLEKYNRDNFIYLPLIFNKSRLRSIGKTIDTILSSDNPQILIKSEQLRNISKNNINKSRKIHIIFNYKQQNNLANVINKSISDKVSILPTEENTLGCDTNIKHNLIADSNGNFYSDILNSTKINNKNRFVDNLNEIVTLFSIKTEDRTVKQKYRYEKLLRSNESLLKTYLSGLIKDWKNSNILHLVFEDLNMINDKSYYQYKDCTIKYSRLSRLLRLGQIKYWVASMAEKQGLFTHMINPAYTSQECKFCHYISRNNRTKQEEFCCKNPKCISHNIKLNADINAAQVIKSRLLNNELRYKLGKDNVYLCSRTKSVYYKTVKSIVEDNYKIGVVTELLPKAKLARSKEDSVLNHTEAPSFRSV